MSAMAVRSLALLSALIVGIAVAVAATPSRAEVKEIRIAVQFGLFNLPVTVAEAQGFFTEEGRKAGLGDLKVKIWMP